MRIMPRAWWQPYHDRISDACWSLRGGRVVLRFVGDTTIQTDGIEFHGRNFTLDFGGATVSGNPVPSFDGDGARNGLVTNARFVPPVLGMRSLLERVDSIAGLILYRDRLRDPQNVTDLHAVRNEVRAALDSLPGPA